ncbi:MAG: hypothetical protein GHCLOJNM_03216 [bacterium]|nr:hypothetical protein [bacterium]
MTVRDRFLAEEVEAGLAELPLIDAHTHLVGGRFGARGLEDILLYHMAVTDLYAAGCPSGNRLTEFPGWPTREEAIRRIEEAIPFLPRVRNTSASWAIRIILKDLYAWEEPITRENWRNLDALVRERAEDRSWGHSVLDRLNIRRTVTEYARRGEGVDDDRLQYALEWAFFTRCQWGEFDTALYELEHSWGKSPQSPTGIGKGRRVEGERRIRSLADVHAALDHYVNSIPYDCLVAHATHLSTDIDYRVVGETEMEQALKRREQAGPEERDIYASYVHERFLHELEPHADTLAFQFSFGAEPLPFETGSRLSHRTLAQLAEMVARHPRVRFQCFLASRPANQALCTLARELPNLSLIGCWWHNFFPDAIREVMGERLDMLPLNKQIGFFSDAYCVEWSYGKATLLRKQLAAVLSDRIRRGQYSMEEALSIAREILFESPQSLLGIRPRSVT